MSLRRNKILVEVIFLHQQVDLGDHQAGQFYLDSWMLLEGSKPNGSNGSDEIGSNRDRSNENGSNAAGPSMPGGSSQEIAFGLKFHFKRNLTR